MRKWSPYKFTEYATLWADNKASVYAWDQKQVESDIAAANQNPKRFSVWPETFMREPLSDGVRLSRVTDGFEGQIWRNGFLSATRWWSVAPSPREWLTFLRTAGLDLSEISQNVPTPTESYILATPWTVGATSADDVWSLLQTERFIAVAATIIVAPFLYLLTQAMIISLATNQSNAAMDELSETNQTVRVSRSNALINLDNIESYLSLELFPPQYEVISTASNILQGRDLVISEWVYDNGNLELAIESTGPLDSTFFIEAFEGSSQFSNVSGTSGVQQNSLRLSMQVTAQEWPTS